MQQKNKIRCHSKLDLESSTLAVLQQQQQRPAWKILKQVQDDGLFYNNGFTLIELLVVVLIIGILAAVALPQYQKAVYKSRYAAMKNLVQSMYDAEQAYYLANGQYTEDFDNLSIDVSGRNGNMLHARYPLPNTVCALGPQYVYCKNSKIDLAYARFYSGGRYCVFYNENQLAQQICKQETNNATPKFSSDTWYPYP